MMFKTLKGLPKHFKQSLNLWTFILPAVVMLALSSVAYGLGTVIPQLNYRLLISIALLSMLVAWILAVTGIRGVLAFPIALFLGIPLALVRAGGLESELMASLRRVLSFLIGEQATSSQIVIAQTPLQKLGSDIAILLGRSQDWLLAAFSGKPTFDPVVTVLVWSLALWMVSFWAGWIVQRTKNPMLGIFPAGAMLSMTLSYMLGGTSSLLMLLSATLILYGVIQQQSLEKRWRQEKTSFYPDVRNKSLLFVTAIALGIVTLAAITPSITITDLAELGKRWTTGSSEQSDGIAESLGLSSKPRRERIAIDNVRFSGLPQDQLIGSGPELNEKIVMRIKILDEEPASADRTYYWRSVTYDRYIGNGWATSGTTTEPYRASQLVASSKVSFQQPLTQEVEVIGSAGHLLYYSGILVSANQDFLLSQRTNGDVFGASIDAESYGVESLISAFNEDSLRKTGNDYPDWIQNRYLALPEDIPQRVRDLAQELTATAQTPYDRALTIESYLRTFPYSLQVPSTSGHRDIADHFLFDLKRGYCGYYASTMVVMARAAGLPARIVIGYASNNYDEASGYYNVTKADAHAWVEVYFPEYGWVEFEPTPNRPVIPRLLEPSTNELPVREELEQSTSIFNFDLLPLNLDSQTIFSGFFTFLGIFILGVILAAIIWLIIDTLRLRVMSSRHVVETLYQRLKRFAQRLGVPCQDGYTPHEFAAAFTKHLNQHYRKGAPLTEILQPIQTLVHLYVQVNYMPDPLDPIEIDRAVGSWGTLRRQLFVLWLQGLWHNKGNMISKKRLASGSSQDS